MPLDKVKSFPTVASYLWRTSCLPRKNHSVILPPSAATFCTDQDVDVGVLHSKEALILDSMKKAQSLKRFLLIGHRFRVQWQNNIAELLAWRTYLGRQEMKIWDFYDFMLLVQTRCCQNFNPTKLFPLVVTVLTLLGIDIKVKPNRNLKMTRKHNITLGFNSYILLVGCMLSSR